MIKVLITGGAGFIGSIVAREMLARGYSVRVFDNLLHNNGSSLLSYLSATNFEFYHGDIRDKTYCLEATRDIDFVIHLAAIVGDPASQKDPELTSGTNLNGSYNMIDASQKNKVKKFIFVSTCSNYGKIDTSAMANEESLLNPISLYAKTKVEIEEHLIENENGLDWTILRLATAYGVSPRMRFDLTINDFTAQMYQNKTLLVYGEQFWRPYVHIQDIAEGIFLVMSKSDLTRHEIYNIGDTDENYRKIDVVNLIRQYIPSSEIKFVSKLEDPRDYRVCFDKAREQLGLEPKWTVNDGVEEVIKILKTQIIVDVENSVYYNDQS